MFLLWTIEVDLFMLAVNNNYLALRACLLLTSQL